MILWRKKFTGGQKIREKKIPQGEEKNRGKNSPKKPFFAPESFFGTKKSTKNQPKKSLGFSFFVCRQIF